VPKRVLALLLLVGTGSNRFGRRGRSLAQCCPPRESVGLILPHAFSIDGAFGEVRHRYLVMSFQGRQTVWQ
jgi:hypothetical protein